DLLAVDEEVAVLRLDTRGDRREIGPRARLRESLAPDLLGGEDLRQVPLFLLLAAVGHDRRARHADADHAHVLRSLGAGELLEHDRLVAVWSPLAAVLLRPGQAGVPGLVELAAPLAARLGGQ